MADLAANRNGSGLTALYKRFRREEEAEHVREAGGPSEFIVHRALAAGVGEIDAVPPAALEQTLVEEVGITQMAQALGGAHVEPDFEIGPALRVTEEGEDAAVIPPDGRAHDSELAEDLRVLQAQIERDETAERGASQGGVGGAGLRTVGLVDKGFYLLEKHPPVGVAFPTGHAEVACWGVLGHAANTAIGDTDEDDGLDLAGFG